jgi:hypothetical protein
MLVFKGTLHAEFNGIKTPWPESASEMCQPSDRRFSAKLLPTFADRECHVVSVTDAYGRSLDFLDRKFNGISVENAYNDFYSRLLNTKSFLP